MEKNKETQDKELVKIQEETKTLVNRAQNYQVVSEIAYEEATKVISYFAGVRKKIEERRKFYVQPLNEQVKKINELWKGYLIPLDTADKIMRDKMLVYHQEQEKKRLEEEEKTRKEAEKVAKKENISVEEVMAGVEIKEVPKTVGTTTVSKRWTFRIIDFAKVPRIYLELNEVVVNEAIREGKREISGLEIYQKEEIKTK